MKAFFSKAACVSALSCGLSVLPFAARADVYGWNDLKDAISSGQSIALGDDVESAGDMPVWASGSENVSGSGHTFWGNDYNGFIIQNGALYFSDVTAENFNRFLSNLSTGIDPDSDPEDPEMYTVNIINGIFRNNTEAYAEEKGGSVVYNEGTVKIDNSTFVNNQVVGDRGGDVSDFQNWQGSGGAIHNTGTAVITNSEFKGNSAAKGGAVYNTGSLTVTGGSFTDNNAMSGGAIYSSGDLTLNSGTGLMFSGNSSDWYAELDMVGHGSNDIYMDNAKLTINASGGDVAFSDGINGVNYDVTISGTGENSVFLRGSGLQGAKSVLLNGANVELFGGSSSSGIGAESLSFANSPTITLNITMQHPLTGGPVSPYMEITGDVSGSANLVIKPDSDEVLSPDNSLVFLRALNDDLSTETDFKVTRVYLSPYMWDVKVESGESDTGSVWSVYMTEELNNGGDGSRILTPEIVAYIGAQGIALEQHRNMVASVRDKVASNKFPAQGKYGMREDHFRNQTGLNMWVNPTYSYASLSAPVDWDANITGGDFGFDVQEDLYNKLGIFGSYRYGEYEFSGDGEAFASPLGSDIKDSSFMAGLYYRYDKGNFWSFATVYGGKHSFDISVEDGAVSETTSAGQFGGSLEIGHTYVPAYNLTLEPSLGVFYTMVDMDDIADDYGKTAEYDMLHQIEGEVSLKLEKTFDYGYGYSKVYLKPSLIKTFVTGNSVAINGLQDVDTYDNQTLGRIELGGRYAVDGRLSLYGYVNYTTGNDYNNASVGAGFNYRFQ